jgi:branched-chain amino acid transport system ATP-binding protein
MDVVRELSDRIIVLHNGQLVADGEPAEVIASPVVQQAYLGHGGDAAGKTPPGFFQRAISAEPT